MSNYIDLSLSETSRFCCRQFHICGWIHFDVQIPPEAFYYFQVRVSARFEGILNIWGIYTIRFPWASFVSHPGLVIGGHICVPSDDLACTNIHSTYLASIQSHSAQHVTTRTQSHRCLQLLYQRLNHMLVRYRTTYNGRIARASNNNKGAWHLNCNSDFVGYSECWYGASVFSWKPVQWLRHINRHRSLPTLTLKVTSHKI